MIGLDLIGATDPRTMLRRMHARRGLVAVGSDYPGYGQLFAEMTQAQGLVDEALAKIPLVNAPQKLAFSRERASFVSQWNDANKPPASAGAAFQAAKNMEALYERINASNADKVSLPAVSIPWWAWAIVAVAATGAFGAFIALPLYRALRRSAKDSQ